jgi:hypothetical protein
VVNCEARARIAVDREMGRVLLVWYCKSRRCCRVRNGKGDCVEVGIVVNERDSVVWCRGSGGA